MSGVPETVCKRAERSLELGVQKFNAVNLKIESRSAAELGFMEITVLDDFGITGVFRVGIDVGKILYISIVFLKG